MKRHIPNGLTLLRLILAPIFPFVPESWRFPILVVAGLTEFLDGFFARRWGTVSSFGRTMDPVADKAFVLAVVLTLFMDGAVELWEVAAIGVRDAVVLIGATTLFFVDRDEFHQASARLPGKICTILQFTFLLVGLVTDDVPLWLTLLTGAASVVAGIDYSRFYWRKTRASQTA